VQSVIRFQIAAVNSFNNFNFDNPELTKTATTNYINGLYTVATNIGNDRPLSMFESYYSARYNAILQGSNVREVPAGPHLGIESFIPYDVIDNKDGTLELIACVSGVTPDPIWMSSHPSSQPNLYVWDIQKNSSGNYLVDGTWGAFGKEGLVAFDTTSGRPPEIASFISILSKCQATSYISFKSNHFYPSPNVKEFQTKLNPINMATEYLNNTVIKPRTLP
jgi:hypothetical protein